MCGIYRHGKVPAGVVQVVPQSQICSSKGADRRPLFAWPVSSSLVVSLGAATLGLAFLTPGHYLPWASFQSQWVSAIAVLIIAAAMVGRSADVASSRLPLPSLAALSLMLAVAPLLQFVFGEATFFSDALLSSLYLLGMALAIVTGAVSTMSDRHDLTTSLFGALLAAAAVSVALALLQWLQFGSFLFVADLRPGDRPGANLSQPNHLATLLSLGVVGSLYFFETRRLAGFTCALLLAWLGLGLAMTQSRTGWLSMALLAAWCLWKRGSLGLRVRPAAIGIAAALFVALVAAWSRINEALLLGGGSLQERLKPGTRWLHWQALWEAAWLEPWSGYGWQQVSTAQLRTVLGYPPTQEMVQNSHNLLLDLMLWNGAWLGLAVMGCLVWWYVKQVRNCGSTERFTLIAAVSVIGVHALLEYPLDHVYFLLPFGLLIGLLELPGTPKPVLPRPLFAGALAFMLAMLLWIGDEYLTVEQANRDVRLLLAGYGVDKVPSVPPPDVRLLDGPREYHRFMITPARPGMREDELDWLLRVMQRNAYPPAMMRYAVAAGLNGRPDEAALTLRRLCHMHVEARCDEARDAWAAVQRQYAVLRAVSAP